MCLITEHAHALKKLKEIEARNIDLTKEVAFLSGETAILRKEITQLQKKSPVSQAEIDKSMAIIKEGRNNHLYYVEHPSTDPEVGDVAHNQVWVDNYDLLKSVIERLRK